jgi:hypothetical protein
MQTIIQALPDVDDLTDIDKAIDYGATTVYVQGGRCDRLIRDGEIDAVAKAVDHIKSQGLQAGIGAHSIQVPIICEKAGLEPDYYFKTCHHDDYWSAIPRKNRPEFCIVSKNHKDHDKFHDNIWDLYPEQTIDFMANVKVPWIGFKVLAAGALHPNDGFKYAFQNGADFICVGMFDFQVVEDVNIAVDVIAGTANRPRPWYA